VDRIIVLEKKEVNTGNAGKLPTELKEQVNDHTAKLDCYLARLEEVETIVE
jgi:hypothetical protein